MVGGPCGVRNLRFEGAAAPPLMQPMAVISPHEKCRMAEQGKRYAIP